MTDFSVRDYRKKDRGELISLWNRVFGDPSALIEAFFELLPHMGSGVVAEAEGKIVGAAYMIRGLDHVRDGKTTSCAYIYAVATDEAFRGRGIGAALTKAAKDAAKQWQAKIISTLPAEDSLYKWYDELIEVKPALYRIKKEIDACAVLPCRQCTASEYVFMREALLSGREYLSVSLPVMEFQRLICREYGGDIYIGEDFAGFGYMEEGKALIKELIIADESKKYAAAASLVSAMGAKKGLLFENSEDGDKYIAVDTDNVSGSCLWNVSFD